MGNMAKLTRVVTTLAIKLAEIASFALPPRPLWKCRRKKAETLPKDDVSGVSLTDVGGGSAFTRDFGQQNILLLCTSPNSRLTCLSSHFLLFTPPIQRLLEADELPQQSVVT